jgi:hypothetical protein
MTDELKKFIQDHRSLTKAYLIAENSERPGVPGEIITMRHVLISYINDAPILCYKVRYSNHSIEYIPFQIEGQKVVNEYTYKYFCKVCFRNTLEEPNYHIYEVTNAIWKQYGNKKGCLCIDCLQDRTGRLLGVEDFTDAPVNKDNKFVVNLKFKDKQKENYFELENKK